MNDTISNTRSEPPVIVGDWEDRFSLQYAAASHKNRKRRRNGMRAPRRSAAPADAHQDDRSLAQDVAIERARSLADIKRLRQAVGYRFFGGAVGGNPLYGRQGFVFRGLVSDEAPILKLFATKTPRARRLLTGDTKDRVDSTDSKLLALDSPYVTTNARMRGVIRVDIDARLDSWAAVSVMCDQARIPLPNVAVGHVDKSGQVFNPHLIWIIANSVAFTPKARQSPQRLFLGVQRGLTAALAPHGADPGGLSNALHMKNPLSPVWGRAILCPTPYHLTDLRTEADIRLAPWAHAPENHPPTTPSMGSNRGFWDLCTWARRNAMSYRPAGLYDEFFQAVEAEAVRLFVPVALNKDRDVRTAQNAASRVSRWTWDRHDPRNLPAAPLPPDELRRRQVAAGQATVVKRRTATESAIIEAAKILTQAQGATLTQSTLMGATGKSERTIRRYWPTVRDLLLNTNAEPADAPRPAICSPLDKKEAAARPALQEPAEDPSQPPLLTPQNWGNIIDAETASLHHLTAPPPTVEARYGIDIRNGTELVQIRFRHESRPFSPKQAAGHPICPQGPERSFKHRPAPAPRTPPAAPDHPDINHPTPSFDLMPMPLDVEPKLPTKELAHAALMNALNGQPLIGQNVLVENVAGEAVGPFTERYRSLFATFLRDTKTPLHRDATEQTGKEVWEKLWQNSRNQGYAHLRNCNLLALYLEPRQELRLKTAREAFEREAIDYAEVIGTLIWHRLAHGLPTWVFTPRRLDDPEFIAVYGPALAGLLDTSFAPIRFGERSTDQVTRRPPLDPGHLRWLDDPPAHVFVHPNGGVDATVTTNDQHQPTDAAASGDQAACPDPRTALATRTADAVDASPYAAEMARLHNEYVRLRRRLAVPSPAPAMPNLPGRERAREALRGQPLRRFYRNDLVTPPPLRRTFHADYTASAQLPAKIASQDAVIGQRLRHRHVRK